MEPTGSLFPSLVVVGHVVTLAAVWHWRRGRRQAQDEQGKRPCLSRCHRPPPYHGDASGVGGGRSASLPPLLFLTRSETPVLCESVSAALLPWVWQGRGIAVVISLESGLGRWVEGEAGVRPRGRLGVQQCPPPQESPLPQLSQQGLSTESTVTGALGCPGRDQGGGGPSQWPPLPT